MCPAAIHSPGMLPQQASQSQSKSRQTNPQLLPATALSHAPQPHCRLHQKSSLICHCQDSRLPAGCRDLLLLLLGASGLLLTPLSSAVCCCCIDSGCCSRSDAPALKGIHRLLHGSSCCWRCCRCHQGCHRHGQLLLRHCLLTWTGKGPKLLQGPVAGIAQHNTQ